MRTRTWIFPEHGGTIPGIPGHFPGGTKVEIDEDTNMICSISALYVQKTSGMVKTDETEIVTPGYKTKKAKEPEGLES